MNSSLEKIGINSNKHQKKSRLAHVRVMVGAPDRQEIRQVADLPDLFCLRDPRLKHEIHRKLKN